MFAGFDELQVKTNGATLFVRRAGAGPPVLLLHGFPETHLMWRGVAPLLARRFTVVTADLPGYGRSTCPDSAPDHAPHAKRAMALHMLELMDCLGLPRFSMVGHDRGGRIAYRLALDHPERVERLVLLDIVPTAAAWDLADDRFALSFWPWSILAQDEPLPERLLSAAPEAIVEEALRGWGTPSTAFAPTIRAAYVDTLRDPARVHAICEEYRAAATLDRRHDERDRQERRRISCPVRVLWSERGPLQTWYASEGGPLALWKPWCDHVEGGSIAGGHFFPEELPVETAEDLAQFLSPLGSPPGPSRRARTGSRRSRRWST